MTHGLSALALLCALCLCTQAAMAQHGGGGSPGGGMGGQGGGMMGGGGDRMGRGMRGLEMNLPRVPMRSGPQLGLSGRWWDDGKTVKKIGLRNDQQRRMDDIFEANKPALVNLFTNLQTEEAKLVSLPAGDLQDETKVFAAIDRVSQARADLEKENAHILMQIRQQMDPTQLAALDHAIAAGQ
jgi:Spy/CpxP family protein refolding chaperone